MPVLSMTVAVALTVTLTVAADLDMSLAVPVAKNRRVIHAAIQQQLQSWLPSLPVVAWHPATPFSNLRPLRA